MRVYCAIAQWFEVCLCVVYCVEDLNPYQLSCPGSSVGRALAKTAECHGFEGSSPFFLQGKKKTVLGVVNLFVVPLPFYL